MENINIKIYKSTRKVDLPKSVIGNDGENLQEKLIFEFDEFVDGVARLELQRGTEKSYIMLEKVDETYEIPVRSVITKTGKLNLQVVITEGSNIDEIPIFKSNIFYVIVNSSINAEIEQPDEYPQWMDIANAKINEIDEAITNAERLDVDVSKQEHTTTISITKQDGTTKSENVDDGIGLLYQWQGTRLGVKRENDISYEYVDLQGPQGQAGTIRMLIVNELPLTGETGVLYFVPKQEAETKDLYDEYTWLNGAWELLGEKQIDIDLTDYYTKQETNTLLDEKASVSDIPDLTDYVKNTDYATSSKAGIIKAVNGFNVGSTGNVGAGVSTYANYLSSSDVLFIGKGTLENVITGKQLVNQTYVDNLVGDISNAIDLINGEVI